MEGYFDSRINGNNANAWNYYNNMNNGMVEQHQRHFFRLYNIQNKCSAARQHVGSREPNPNKRFLPKVGEARHKNKCLVDQRGTMREASSAMMFSSPHVSMNMPTPVMEDTYRQIQAMPPSQSGECNQALQWITLDAYTSVGQYAKNHNYGHRQ